MSKSVFAAIAALGFAAAAGASAAEVGPGRFSVTNDTSRVVECNFQIDGVTYTYLKVHPAKTFATSVDPSRSLSLVCMRGKEGVYTHLKLGTDYRFVAAPSLRVDLKTATAD